MNQDQLDWCAELMRVLSADTVYFDTEGEYPQVWISFYRFGREILGCHNTELEDQLHART